jgi:hypothetical protein
MLSGFKIRLQSNLKGTNKYNWFSKFVFFVVDQQTSNYHYMSSNEIAISGNSGTRGVGLGEAVKAG